MNEHEGGDHIYVLIQPKIIKPLVKKKTKKYILFNGGDSIATCK